ncbi:hypothetical protein EJ04DRAFT_527754 [Polyplosphaeria fusca]|uniref:RING-type domain-containing protein n=1 Tax=Polyplosphaeria fusca TaxID=682080 RepID=A0A9P4QRI0_9PLEO|nr:hypothetical protein EJ04DRAFT_527754 [Polyplosphaeria fusca]
MGDILARHCDPLFRWHQIWTSLSYIGSTFLNSAKQCQICSDSIQPPRSGSWRLHGCGHQFHVQCFRTVNWESCGVTHVQEKPCLHCNRFEEQSKAKGNIYMRKGIEILEKSLISHRSDLHCYLLPEPYAMRRDLASTAKNIPAKAKSSVTASISKADDASASSVSNRHSAQSVQSSVSAVSSNDPEAKNAFSEKAKWRRSVPPQADLEVLNHVARVNPQHPVFEALDKLWAGKGRKLG